MSIQENYIAPNMSKKEFAIEIKQLNKSYKSGNSRIQVIKDIQLEIMKGDFVSIKGASGSGKSTFLNLLGSLDRPDSGEIFVNQIELGEYFKKNKIHIYRKKEIGFVFQSHYLMADFTLLENIMIPLLLLKKKKKDAKIEALNVLERVGLLERANHFPYQVSGGESQRAAFARAIVHKPSILLADEPTGNLDSINTEKFINTLTQLQNEFQQTIVLVTHEKELAESAKKCYTMKDGQLFLS